MVAIFQLLALSTLVANAVAVEYIVNFVYRADRRPPNVIMKDGGFRTKADTNHLKPDYSLYDHAAPVDPKGATAPNDGYVSTSWDRRVCSEWVTTQLKSSAVAYVYKISADEGFIDVAATLRQYNPYPREREYAAKDTVPWKYISEWTEYKHGKEGKTYRNPDFSLKTIKYNASGPKYERAGFPANHPAWKESPWKQTKANPLYQSYSKYSSPYKPHSKTYYYKRDEVLAGRQDLVHFAQIRAAKASVAAKPLKTPAGSKASATAKLSNTSAGSKASATGSADAAAGTLASPLPAGEAPGPANTLDKTPGVTYADDKEAAAQLKAPVVPLVGPLRAFP